MSWKHSKFDKSTIFRSLERIAIEKGIVKPEEIKKEASNKELDLNPSDNLVGNIMKLCAGLRHEGMSKYADELELNFLNYKKAQTLYETTKETGEDLVDMAHPKGSHRLEGVEGDSVFETIIDQHLKGVEIANKKPHGKLSTAKNIIDAVKISLAIEEDEDKILDKQKVLALQELRKIIPKLQSFYKQFSNAVKHVGAKVKFGAAVANILATLKANSFATPDLCEEVSDNLDEAGNSLSYVSTDDLIGLGIVLALPGIGTVVGTGYEAWIHKDDVAKKKDRALMLSALSNQITMLQGYVDRARGILAGSQDSTIKKVLEDEYAKMQEQKDQKQQAQKDISGKTDAHAQVISAIALLQSAKAKAQNMEQTSRAQALSYIDKKINEGVSLSAEVMTQPDTGKVKMYVDQVNGFIQAWNLK